MKLKNGYWFISKINPIILKQIGLEDYFCATADGNNIKKSKPDPEIFLLAAERLGISPEECLVIEDADAGIEAALAVGIKVVGIGSLSKNQLASLASNDLTVRSIKDILLI